MPGPSVSFAAARLRRDFSSELVDAGGSARDGAGPRMVEERPPPGLARGKYAWPAWGIGVVGGLVFALGLAWLVFRLRKLRRR
jgi:hypothetical protein